MISSKFILQRLESFSKSGKVFGRSVDIFENPTSSDLKELSRQSKDFQRSLLEVRYIADAKKQKVFVFDAELAIHADVRTILDYSTEHYKTSFLLNGEAKFQNGKLYTLPQRNLISKSFFYFQNYPSQVDKLYLEEVLKYDWSWLEKYVIGIDSEIKTIKKTFGILVKKIYN